MNLLVTAIGSMSAECVVDSLRKAGCGVVATDIYPREYHPVVARCVGFEQVPRVAPDALAYCSAICDAAVQYGCRAIIPLTDPEVDVLSNNRGFLKEKGVDLWLAPDVAIRRARAKEAWQEHLGGSVAFRLIPSYDGFDALAKEHRGDFVAKRINGRSSEGILFSNTEAFGRDRTYDRGYIFQPFVEGDIITVDFVRHPVSRQLVAVPRKELMRTKNGAGTVVEILDPSHVAEAVREIAEKLDLSGVMNCEFIRHRDILYLMDINPRFSAGVSFSKMAGYDFVRADIDCYLEGAIRDLGDCKIGKVFVKRFCDF